MPSDLVGKAHGLLIGVGTGGGGQTSGPDWSGVPNHYPSIVHELGHQLGLEHEPRGSGSPTPIYTSLMNYDYSYQFDGDADAIHYSRGEFASLRIDERNLEERLPFSADALSFLKATPYAFDVEARTASSASVDWNRNGVHDEGGIAADVNDGYALNVGMYNHVAETTGDVALAAQGDVLVGFTTQVHRADPTAYAGGGASDVTPARLGYVTVRDRDVLQSGSLTSAAIMTGAPSAIAKNGRILVAFPGLFNTIQIGAFTLGRDARLAGSITGFNPGSRREVTLVDVGETAAVEMVLWNPANGNLEIRRIDVGSDVRVGEAQPVTRTGSSVRVVSSIPPGATFNTRTNRLVLLAGRDTSGDSDRLVLQPLARSGAGWRGEEVRWLSYDRNVKSPNRPVILFDSGRAAGPGGRYLVYFRTAMDLTGDGRHRLTFIRVMPPDTDGAAADAPYVHRQRMFINGWVATRNAPAVTPYEDDYAVIWRTPEAGREDQRNRAEINLFASGEFANGPADFDDITYIATEGMRDSLRSVRGE